MTEPRTYTHPDVYLRGVAQGWADPQTDPTRIDWPTRQAAAAIPFTVVNGRPVNPGERTGIRHGRNQLGHWGEAQCADAAVTATDTTGGRWIVMIERRDGHGWALPGGHVDPGEAPADAAGRELTEETGLVVTLTDPWVRTLPARYVPDPRCSDEAWMVTTLTTVDLGPYEPESLPLLTAGDDASRARWIRAGGYAELARHLAATTGGVVFAAHQQMLAELLGEPAWPALEMMATIDGIALSDIGDDGDVVAVGHHDPRRLLAALRRYAREAWGEALEPADPTDPSGQIRHEWVVNTGGGTGLEQWCLEPAPADAPGAFPVTRWAEGSAGPQRPTRDMRPRGRTRDEDLERTDTTAAVLYELARERSRQDAKWGQQNHPDGTGPEVVWAYTGPAVHVAQSARAECERIFGEGNGTWRDILTEEIAEAYAEADPKRLRCELVQVAAVAVAWIEAIDRRRVAANPKL